MPKYRPWWCQQDGHLVTINRSTYDCYGVGSIYVILEKIGSNLILDRAIKISLDIYITSIRWLGWNCVLKYYNHMTSTYVEHNRLVFTCTESVSFRYILRWEWLFGELEKEKKKMNDQ